MVLVGKVNKEIVLRLYRHGHPAVGLAAMPPARCSAWRGARARTARTSASSGASNASTRRILDARHDLAHPVEGDTAWSESYYFNAYDEATDSGLFSRIGIRPNEGTMDVGMSLWLPGGELGEYRWVKEQREMVDTVLEVGAVRYEMLEALQSWRLTMDGEVQARPCVRGRRRRRTRSRWHSTCASTPSRPPSAPTASRAAARSRPRRPPRRARWARATSSRRDAGRARSRVDGVRHEWRGAHGNRDRSWGPRRWGGPKMWRWFSINIGDDMHFGGIRLGTDAGDLHRGWVWDGGAGRVGGRVARAHRAGRRRRDPSGRAPRRASTRRGAPIPLRGDVLRVADIGQAGGTMVNEGLARWTYDDPDGHGTHRVRHLRVPAPARRRREAGRPRRVAADGARPDSEELAAALGRALGGTRRATCAASRAAPRG